MIQEILFPHHITLGIQREDLVHPEIQGNKYRKLKYNIALAKTNALKTIVTFGGAYSNHIAATAIAGKVYGFKTVGIIRGEELGLDITKTLATNSTLSLAKENGMQFHFLSRQQYRLKDADHYLKKLRNSYKNTLILPEGGTNELAIKGCSEILDKDGLSYDYVCCPVGTAGTISGIIEASQPHQKVLGFPALKGEFFENEIQKWTSKTNYEMLSEFHFGGYAKVTKELILFINSFVETYKIPLDPVYTGKMIFGIFEGIKKGFFPPNSRILAIHTGGLQGIDGMNKKLKEKGLPLLLKLSK